MDSLALRKAILRTRSVEFLRLLMSSMLEEANDTFSAMLNVLSTELSQCNLSVDQFLEVYVDLINELRIKVNNKEDEDLNVTAANVMQKSTTSSKNSTNTVSIEQFQRPVEVITVHPSTPNQQSLPTCKRCRRNLSAFRKLILKDYCNTCYYKIRHNQQFREAETTTYKQPLSRAKQIGCRQCSDCMKFVQKGGVFYRSARLCKNCYERHRLIRRKSEENRIEQNICFICNNASAIKLLHGRCVSCFEQSRQEEEMHKVHNNERTANWLNLIDESSGISDNSNSVNKLVTSQCQSPALAIKVESPPLI